MTNTTFVHTPWLHLMEYFEELGRKEVEQPGEQHGLDV